MCGLSGVLVRMQWDFSVTLGAHVTFEYLTIAATFSENLNVIAIDAI